MMALFFLGFLPVGKHLPESVQRFLAWPGAPLLTALLVYLLGSVYLWPIFAYEFNVDTVGYLEVAEAYLRGDWQAAINAYWSPLYSWLMVPFLALNFSPLAAATWPIVLSSALGLISFFWLLKLLRLNLWWLLAWLPFAWFTAFMQAQPDGLAVTWLMGFSALLLAAWQQPSRRTLLALALTVAVGYLIKNYLLWVGLGGLFWLGLLSWRYRNPQLPWKRVLASLLLALTLSLPWAIVISLHMGYLTLGTTGSYNHRLVRLKVDSTAFDEPHPMHTQGLLTPPYDQSTSAWDDPSYLSLPVWKLDSLTELGVQANIVLDNLWHTLLSLWALSPGITVIYLLAFVTLVWWYHKRQHPSWVLLAGLIVLYPLGYQLLLLQTRYLWPLLPLLLVFNLRVLGELNQGPKQNLARLFSWVLVGLMVLSPLVAIDRYQQDTRRQNQIIYLLHHELEHLPERSRLASNGHWHISDRMAYLNNLQYHGEVGPERSDAEVLAMLQKHEIDYFLVWDDRLSPERGHRDDYAFVQDWPELTHGKLRYFQLYQTPWNELNASRRP